jgi:integrase
MASDQAKRRRGTIREREGTFQVRVYLGVDPVTGERVDLTGTAPTEREAEKLLTRFLAEKDARRAARSRITFSDACDRWLENLDVEVKTKHEYAGYVRRTLRPVFGSMPVARLDALAIESLYAQLRRCRRLCRPGEQAIDHRTDRDHPCDRRCRPHKCRPSCRAPCLVSRNIAAGPCASSASTNTRVGIPS